MPLDQITLILIIIVSSVLYATRWLPFEATSLLVITSIALTGLLLVAAIGSRRRPLYSCRPVSWVISGAEINKASTSKKANRAATASFPACKPP